MDKERREKNILTMQQCVADSEQFLNSMDFLEIEAAGFSFRNALKLEIETNKENEFHKESIVNALKKKMEDGINGTDDDFGEAYSTMLFAVRMLYAIHEHTRIIDWYNKTRSEENAV